MKAATILLILLLCGCAATPADSEASREIVLQYLRADVGTEGPFSNQKKKELEVLSPEDKHRAIELLGGGAVGFLIFEPGIASATRVEFVSKSRVVGDFRAAIKLP